MSGRYGHFSNFQASVLLKELNLSRMQHLVGMHVSEKNNLPSHAYRALCTGADCSENWIQLANQQDGISWREVR